MEDSITVHVVHGFHELPHVAPHKIFCQVVPPASDELIDVHIHELKHERQSARRLITATQLINHSGALSEVAGRMSSLGESDVRKWLKWLGHCLLWRPTCDPFTFAVQRLSAPQDRVSQAPANKGFVELCRFDRGYVL